MTTEEFKAKRAGEDLPDLPDVTKTMSASNFIMNRGKELIEVSILGPDGMFEIEIRARLTKGEIKNHAKFLEIFTEPEEVDEEIAEASAAAFLSVICTDDELDEDFWNSPDIDPYVAQQLIVAFMNKAAETLESVRKFRTK